MIRANNSYNAPPVGNTNKIVLTTGNTELGTVSFTGDPLQSSGVIVLYTEIPIKIRFCPTATLPDMANAFALPEGYCGRMFVSPWSSFFGVEMATIDEGSLYWYLASE